LNKINCRFEYCFTLDYALLILSNRRNKNVKLNFSNDSVLCTFFFLLIFFGAVSRGWQRRRRRGRKRSDNTGTSNPLRDRSTSDRCVQRAAGNSVRRSHATQLQPKLKTKPKPKPTLRKKRITKPDTKRSRRVSEMRRERGRGKNTLDGAKKDHYQIYKLKNTKIRNIRTF